MIVVFAIELADYYSDQMMTPTETTNRSTNVRCGSGIETLNDPSSEGPQSMGIHPLFFRSLRLSQGFRLQVEPSCGAVCHHPPSIVVRFTGVLVAGDELSGDKVGGWGSHPSRIIFLVAAPLLGSCRREELDGVGGR